MIKHLYGMLGTEFRPQDVHIDDYGWNLIFESSSAGLERLARCFERYHDELLFSEYKLHMQCYPNGKQPRPQQDMDIDSSGGTNGRSASQVPHERPDSSGMSRTAGFEGRQLTYLEPITSLESKVDAASPKPATVDAVANPRSHVLPVNLSSHSSDTMRTNEMPPMGTSTSLLSLRSDRDETGSMGSAVTRSDGSRIKRDRCHRCNGEAVPGSSVLVRCSTCPRRYHRRCHQDFPIPANLTETSAWSCASCVKKEAASKEEPKQDKQKPLSKPEELVSNTDPVPEDAPDKLQSEIPDDHGPIVTNGDEESNAQLLLLRSDSKSPQHDTQQHSDPTTNAKLGTGDEHAPLSDADDLVARSFAAAEAQSHSKPPSQKPGKLKITRTKLPPKPPITVATQSQRENQPDQNGSSPSDTPVATSSGISTKATNTNGAVGRGSAADLRALAHERHRTAIKNGAEGHFASEEQRLRHNASENTSRSSPAHQLPSDTAAPQKQSNMAPDPSAPAVAKRVTEREIPESPDEVRRGEASSKDPIINPRISALLQPTEDAFVSPSRQTSNVTPAQDAKSPALMRPRAPSAVVRCQNCQKTIPKDPTGKRKLCSGCKRDAAAVAGSNAPIDAEAAPQTSIAPLQTSFAPVANMGHSPQVVVESAKMIPRSEDVIGTDQQQQGSSVSDDGTRRVACDACRKHNTKCTHHDSVAQALTPITSNEQGDDAARADKPVRGTTSDIVDDALLAQETKPPVVHNPLAAKILGDLQFAPTMQSQLREEPSMAESKILLLKQILDENGDAKTDALVLAIELAEAQRLNFVKSVVGDSSDRPKGSRLILVAMALGSAASRRMQAKDVMDWIDDTIPGYKKGEGNWVSRISAMLSQGRLLSSESGYGGYSGYWREDEWQVGDGGKPKAKWYQLLPEKEEEMWTWCPVLKEPLSPSARREAKKAGKSAVKRAPAAARASTAAPASGPATPKSSTKETVSIYCGSFVQGEDEKRPKANSVDAAGDNAMDIGGIKENDPPQLLHGLKRKHPSRSKTTESFTPNRKDASSSEDEPLSASWKTKRRRGETLLHDRSNHSAVHQPPTNGALEDQMDLDPSMSATNSAERGDRVPDDPNKASKATGTSVGRRKSGLVILYLNGSRRPSTAESADHLFVAKRERLAPSLYDEWPEYRQHASDEHDKLAEIQKRPRKKQLFGRLASHTQMRFAGNSVTQPVMPTTFSPEKRSRARMIDPRPDDPYPWENSDNDPTRKEYKCLEEFFDFPDNMIPIISEGQLAYRDGTRTDDGRLPRAREIFKL